MDSKPTIENDGRPSVGDWIKWCPICLGLADVYCRNDDHPAVVLMQFGRGVWAEGKPCEDCRGDGVDHSSHDKRPTCTCVSSCPKCLWGVVPIDGTIEWMCELSGGILSGIDGNGDCVGCSGRQDVRGCHWVSVLPLGDKNGGT